MNKVYNKNDMVNTKIGYYSIQIYNIYIFYLKKIDTIFGNTQLINICEVGY